MEKVSIIIPIYNVGEYLEQCINSVINQSFSNIEIILVDDGSTDNSGLLCDSFAAKDNRIKVIHQKNFGLSAARNAGLEIATGEYISFIDSDDFIHSDFILELYTAMKDADADIAECEYIEFSDENKSVEMPTLPKRVFSNYELILNPRTLLNVSVCKKLYKKELFDDLRFPVGKYHEDIFVSYILAYKAKKIVFTGKYLYYYRFRIGSITKTALNEKRFNDNIEAFKTNIDYFSKIEENEIVCIIKAWYACFLCGKYKPAKKFFEKSKVKWIKQEIKKTYDEIKKLPYCPKKYKIFFRMFLFSPTLTKFLSKITGRGVLFK